MSDILDDLKMMADHCDQENGDEPCDLGMLLIRAIAEIRKLRGAQPIGEMPEPDMFDQQAHIFAYSTDQMRTYGDACLTAGKAAGYVAGVTSGAKQMFDALQFAAANTTDTEWDERLCEYSESALESVSPEAHTEWKTIRRVANESHQQGYAAGLAAGGKDAERYRWLRDNGDHVIGRDRGCGPEWTYGVELDALIDAALRREVKP